MANESLSEKHFHSEFDKKKLEQLIKDVGKEKAFTYRIKEKNDFPFHTASLLFLDIKFDNDETISAVIKYMKKKNIKKFKNEIFMYKTVIQTLNKDVQSIFPSVIYTTPITDGYDMVVALEDLSELGFQVSPRQVKMNLEEIRLSLKALGKFHAEMYTIKHNKPELFSEATKFIDINNVILVQNNDPVSLFWHNFIKQSVLRTFERLNNQNNDVRAFYDTMNKNGIKEMCLKALEPEEPIAIICHGDYNRNNLMFRYEKGVPVECKVLDLQVPCYGSPSIDIGFVLFMNMESSDWVNHWDSLWRDYYDALQERLQINLGDIPSYLSLESLQSDFKSKCFFSYTIAHFFTYGSFSDINIFFQLEERYLKMDENDEKSRIEEIRQTLDIVETEEMIRITDSLTLEYVKYFGRFYV